jgi:hypothetical protein
MRILILTTEPVSAPQLRAALPDAISPEDAEVMVVAPALAKNALRFWVSDADEAIAKADAVWRESLERLSAAGVAAAGDTGEGDPLEAIADALKTFAADRIVIFAHAGDQQRYREEIDDDQVAERFGLPVDRATLTNDSGS